MRLQLLRFAVVVTCVDVSHGLSSFGAWAEARGVRAQNVDLLPAAPPAAGNGLVATAPLAAGAVVLEVPAKLALQTSQQMPPPSWCDAALWTAAPWDARLALRLLRARSRDSQPEWFALLPESFDTPLFWPAATLALTAYPPLERAVAKQRAEWLRLHQLVVAAQGADAPSEAEWLWALACVRSRAFSGPLGGNTFKGSLAQLAFGTVLAATYVAAGLGTPEQAGDGLAAILVSLLASDLVFSRFARTRRYVLCPFVDMFNHNSTLGGSALSYEYFTDAFSAMLDPAAGPVSAGEQLLISYGPRSNDKLLLYYGFVEPQNDNDEYVLSQEEFLVALATVAPFESSQLGQLRGAGLTDGEAEVSFSRRGASSRAEQLARLLLLPSASLCDEGKQPAASSGEERLARSALAAVAVLEQKRLSEAAGAGSPGGGTAFEALAHSFRAEKVALLESCASALASL